MKNWIKRTINNIRFRKTRKLVATFARDKYGRWLLHPETNQILLKTDDPKVLARATAKSEKRHEELINVLRTERTCKCGGDGMCPCTDGSKMRHPSANKGKLPLAQAEELEKKKATPKKKPTPKKK